MDPSALIFVALAVAWAVYLVPKAVRHHDEAARSRSVERFSETMRVLARREPVGSRDSRLVLSPGRPAASSVVVTKQSVHEVTVTTASGATAPARPAATRASAATAARRRRTVLLTLLGVTLIVAGLVATPLLSWHWLLAPLAVIAAWLVACRLMVRSETGLAAQSQLRRDERRVERGVRADERREARIARRDEREEDFFGDYDPPSALAPADDDGDPTEEVAAVVEANRSAVEAASRAGVWDPVPVTLPTYVDKAPAAPRSVRTIDLDSTGVWTSGRSESDSALAREAEDAERTERAARTRRAEIDARQRRASGS